MQYPRLNEMTPKCNVQSKKINAIDKLSPISINGYPSVK